MMLNIGLIRSDVQCKIFGVKTFVHEGHLGFFSALTGSSNTTTGRLEAFWLLDNLNVEKRRAIRRQFTISLLDRTVSRKQEVVATKWPSS